MSVVKHIPVIHWYFFLCQDLRSVVYTLKIKNTVSVTHSCFELDPINYVSELKDKLKSYSSLQHKAITDDFLSSSI